VTGREFTVPACQPYWDGQADTFDEQPDHGLRDPRVADAAEAVLRQRRSAAVTRLGDPDLWGGPVTDERYLLTSTR